MEKYTSGHDVMRGEGKGGVIQCHNDVILEQIVWRYPLIVKWLPSVCVLEENLLV